MHRWRTWAALATLQVLGCGGEIASAGDAAADAAADAGTDAPCVLQSTSYVTSCQADTDCERVFLGDACNSSCFCPNGAIAATEVPRYETDFAATKHGDPNCFCPLARAVCCLGSCAINGCK